MTADIFRHLCLHFCELRKAKNVCAPARSSLRACVRAYGTFSWQSPHETATPARAGTNATREKVGNRDPIGAHTPIKLFLGASSLSLAMGETLYTEQQNRPGGSPARSFKSMTSLPVLTFCRPMTCLVLVLFFFFAGDQCRERLRNSCVQKN